MEFRDGVACICPEHGEAFWASKLLVWDLAENAEQQLFTVHRESGEVVAVPPIMPVITEFLAFALSGGPTSVPVHTVEQFAVGARLWWEAPCLFLLVVGNVRSKPSAWILDLWPCWGRAFSKLFLVETGFAKSVPREERRPRQWRRWRMEQCLSTLALVWLFVSRITLARPATARQNIREHFRMFLSAFFETECVAMQIVMSVEASVTLGSPRATGEPCIELAVGYGMVQLKNLRKAPNLLTAQVLHLLRQCGGYAAGKQAVPLHEVLAVAVASSCDCLARQFLWQVAMAIDMLFPEKGYTQNVFDVLRELPRGRRWNVDLKDALVMGQMPSGAGAPAFLPA